MYYSHIIILLLFLLNEHLLNKRMHQKPAVCAVETNNKNNLYCLYHWLENNLQKTVGYIGVMHFHLGVAKTEKETH